MNSKSLHPNQRRPNQVLTLGYQILSPPPPGKSNRPPPPAGGPGGPGGFVRRMSVKSSNEERAGKEDIEYKPQAAPPPPPPPPRDIPAPPAGVNPRPSVPNVDSGGFSRRSGSRGEDRRSLRGSYVPAPPVTISVRPPVPQGFKPVNMKSAMQQSGPSVGRLRGVPQSLQPAFQSLNPPPPPGQSSYPSVRRSSHAPPPPPPPRYISFDVE